MLIIVIEESVVVILADFTAHQLIIDNGCHTVRSLFTVIGRVGLNFSYSHSTPLIHWQIETHIFREHSAVHNSDGVPLINKTGLIILSHILHVEFQDIDIFVILVGFCFRQTKGYFCLWLQLDVDIVFALKMVNGDLVGKVICNHLIDHIQTLTDVRGILVVNLLFLASGICKSQFIIQNGIEFFVGKGIFQVSVSAV